MIMTSIFKKIVENKRELNRISASFNDLDDKQCLYSLYTYLEHIKQDLMRQVRILEAKERGIVLLDNKDNF